MFFVKWKFQTIQDQENEIFLALCNQIQGLCNKSVSIFDETFDASEKDLLQIKNCFYRKHRAAQNRE